MARTTRLAVEKLLGDDYNGRSDLNVYIEIATVQTDSVNSCASRKSITLSSTELEIIERCLAAHNYTKMDPTYMSRSTQGKSGQFIRNPKEPEPYKDMAIAADRSGCVNALLNRLTARSVWLGKPPSEQTDYEDRD